MSRARSWTCGTLACSCTRCARKTAPRSGRRTRCRLQSRGDDIILMYKRTQRTTGMRALTHWCVRSRGVRLTTSSARPTCACSRSGPRRPSRQSSLTWYGLTRASCWRSCSALRPRSGPAAGQRCSTAASCRRLGALTYPVARVCVLVGGGVSSSFHLSILKSKSDCTHFAATRVFRKLTARYIRSESAEEQELRALMQRADGAEGRGHNSLAAAVAKASEAGFTAQKTSLCCPRGSCLRHSVADPSPPHVDHAAGSGSPCVSPCASPWLLWGALVCSPLVAGETPTASSALAHSVDSSLTSAGATCSKMRPPAPCPPRCA